jgi:hypothetical protein
VRTLDRDRSLQPHPCASTRRLWNFIGNTALFSKAMLPDAKTLEDVMPIILWFLGVPLVVVVLLMLTHII